MAAVKNILMSNTSISPDVPRPLSKVPFAPFLVFQKEARLSDLSEPREKAPPMANTDRPEHRSRDVEAYDQRRAARRHDTEEVQRDHSDDRKYLERSGGTARPEMVDDDIPVKRHANAEYSENVDQVANGTGEENSPAKTVETSDSSSKTISNETNNNLEAGHAQGDAKNDAQGAVEIPFNQPWAITQESAITISPINQAAAGTGKVGTAAAQSPAMQTTPGTGTPRPSLPADTAAGSGTKNETVKPEFNGKLQLATMSASNDHAQSKFGSGMPQIVRDVHAIVARPTNAAGGNLVQAQQLQNTPVQPANAAPLAQNAGQATPLHVGANSGQNTGGSNGQQTGRQNGNYQTGSTPGQITATTGDPDAAATRNFQDSLARGAANGSVRGPGTATGDVANASRMDAPPPTSGGVQAPLSSNSPSRAAQASTAHHAPPSPATDQVSVQLRKAVDNGESKLRIQLRPHDLGKVEVKLDITGDGRAKVLVMAERPETLEILQRDSRVLERALQDAGLKTDQNSLSFDLQGREGEDRTKHAKHDSENSQGSSNDNDSEAGLDTNEQPIPVTAIGLAPDGSANFLA